MNADAQDQMTAREEVAAGDETEDHYRRSRQSLRFLNPEIESRYIQYRKPRVLQTLRWVLAAGSAMVFLGLLIDFSTLGVSEAESVLIIRAMASLGALGPGQGWP